MGALALLGAAPAAQAAYAPKIAIKLDPATPSAAAAVTSTITQAAGETANKTIVVKFPAGFTASVSAKVTPCTPAQEAAAACPPESQVGSGTAVTSLGSLTGPVYLETDNGMPKLIVDLKGFNGLISQKLTGVVATVGGRIQWTFDNLPNTQTTSVELALQGGTKALSHLTPKCGPAVFDADFTSQNGEKASAQATVDVEGCASTSTPVVSALGASPKAFRAVHKFSDTQRPGYGTKVRWTLSEATNGTRITVQKRVNGRFRKAGSFVGGGDRGVNTVMWDGRVHGKPLPPGPYRLSLRTTSKSGVLSKPATLRFTIRR